MLVLFALASSACSALTESSSSTTRPLGYPTTRGVTTTLPSAAEVAEDDGEPQQLPQELAMLAVPGWGTVGSFSVRPAATVSVTDFGAVPDDEESDSQAFVEAVAFARSEQPMTVTVPPGRFLLTETLALQSGVALQGSGPDVTFIDLDFDGRDIEGITMIGSPFGNGDWISLPTTSELGSTRVAVTESYGAGQIVEIEQDNVERMRTLPDWDVDWGEGSSGEVAAVVDSGDTTIVLDHVLFDTFDVERNARIRPISAVVRSGLESLTLERLDPGYGHTVAIRFAYDVWVRDVDLVRTSRAHVGIDVAGRCEVSNSRIHGAHDYGDGGRAYGISVARHTTACLFEQNSLWDLRHALIIQLGASGNVFGYNDARGSAGYEDRQPRADISIHGHWPQANLFEGNVVDRIVFSDWWGPAGPTNVFWRSCALESVLVRDGSNDQAILASIVGPGGIGIDDEITGTLVAANVVDGEPLDDVTVIGSDPLPTSLYGASEDPPTVNGCLVEASSRNPWAQPGADRP